MTIAVRDEATVTPRGPVLVLSGYGLRLTVRHGHLELHDGVGHHRRTHTLPRAQRDVRRIVILGHTGFVTLEAIRWCTDTGVALIQIDSDGRILMLANAQSRTDARLLRAQAAAAGSKTGVEIAQRLLHLKISGQAAVADQLGADSVALLLTDLDEQLDRAGGLVRARSLEADAANAYFAAWSSNVHPRFTAGDATRVPAGWTRFAGRGSPLITGGRSPRKAADPTNALLNYGYGLAEAECRLAALAVGLDPSLGIVHTDKKHRDSLALDLLEAIRPIVDNHVATLMRQRTFNRNEFTETRDGQCRLAAPLAASLAETLLPMLTRAVGPVAEAAAHLLAGSSPGKITLTTPLSRANMVRVQQRGERTTSRREPAAPKVRPTCQKCGVDLYGHARKLCPTCWPVARREYMRQLGYARAKAPELNPTVEQTTGGWTFEQYQTIILPALAGFRLPEIERATGLSNATCSRLRRGLQVPNPRHWPALAYLATGSSSCPRQAGAATVDEP